MSLRIEESELSRLDIINIWQFIAYGNPTSGDPDAADRVIDAIGRTYEHLAEFPHKTKIKGYDVFRTTVEGFQGYNILYRFDDKRLQILRIFRADLDWTRIIEDL